MFKMKRLARSLFTVLLVLMVIALPMQVRAAETDITVYKSATCDCCKKWIKHLKENGFNVTIHETENLDPIKKQSGVPDDLQSCHTAIVGGYTIEGHVPASDIKRLLSEKPKAKGLAVPGMPVGSPGMEMGDRKEPYKVILFSEDGQQTTYASH